MIRELWSTPSSTPRELSLRAVTSAIAVVLLSVSVVTVAVVSVPESVAPPVLAALVTSVPVAVVDQLAE